MKSQKITKEDRAKPIVSEEEMIKKNSLKLFSYLTLISNLKNKHGEERIFQQKDICLKDIQIETGLDPKTTKKYWELLEQDGLLSYNEPEGFPYEYGRSFSEEWKVRQKFKYGYYSIPKPQQYRLIPELTIKRLVNDYKISELTYKVYIVLLNYQEHSILNGKAEKPFTYEDLRELLGYKKENATNKRLEASLIMLEGLGLIVIGKDRGYNIRGATIPVFMLKQVNKYTHSKYADFSPAEQKVIPKKDSEEIKTKIKAE